jgi:hypothetical protein
MNQSENRLDERHMSLHRVFRCFAEKEGHETRVYANAYVLTKVPLLAEGLSINRQIHYVNRVMKRRSSVKLKTGYEDTPDHHESHGMPVSSAMWIKMSLYSRTFTNLTLQRDQINKKTSKKSRMLHPGHRVRSVTVTRRV